MHAAGVGDRCVASIRTTASRSRQHGVGKSSLESQTRPLSSTCTMELCMDAVPIAWPRKASLELVGGDSDAIHRSAAAAGVLHPHRLCAGHALLQQLRDFLFPLSGRIP